MNLILFQTAASEAVKVCTENPIVAITATICGTLAFCVFLWKSLD